MSNNFFQFDNEFYCQDYGLAMGSSISPVFSDMVMIDLELECIAKLDFIPLFFLRYVDDVITCIPNDKLDQMLHIFNSYNDRIQFTVEIEKNNRISFLDLFLIKAENSIITNWYKKPTFSERFLNFNSSHPKTHKIGIIYSIVDKAIKLSNKKFHEDNLKPVRQFLLKNSYPSKFIEFYLKKRISCLNNFPNNSLLPQICIYSSNNNNSMFHNRNSIYLQNYKIIPPYVPGFYEKTSRISRKNNVITLPKMYNNLLLEAKIVLRKLLRIM